MSNTLGATLAMVLSAVGFASAWGAGDHAGGHGHAAGIGKPGSAADVSRDVEIVIKDEGYDLQSLTVTPGETIRFVVQNEGKLVHELSIGTPHMHEEHQHEMASMMEQGALELDHVNREMMKMDMGGGHMMQHDDANSLLLDPGQSGELIWTFPDGGDLEFACNVPGHYQGGMVGSIHFGKGG